MSSGIYRDGCYTSFRNPSGFPREVSSSSRNSRKNGGVCIAIITAVGLLALAILQVALSLAVPAGGAYLGWQLLVTAQSTLLEKIIIVAGGSLIGFALLKIISL